MRIVLMILAFFVVGAIMDLIITRYTSAIAQRKKIEASILSVVVTGLNFTVMVLVMQNLENSIPSIVSYTLGGGIGTYAGLIKK